MTRIAPTQPVRQRKPREPETKYLRAVRDMSCVITGQHANEFQSVVPAHIRWGLGGGTGLKPPDNRVLPLVASLHDLQHVQGEVPFWRAHVTDSLLMEALIALAEKRYREWKRG